MKDLKKYGKMFAISFAMTMLSIFAYQRFVKRVLPANVSGLVQL